MQDNQVRISRFFQTALLLMLACSVFMPLSAPAGQESRPAIYQAIINDSVAKVQAAIDSGADVNAVYKGDTPLCFALSYGKRWEVAKAIIQSPKVDVRSAANNLTPLVMATTNPDPFKHKNYIKSMKFLLDRKGDVNFQASDGRTPLIAAAMVADQSQGLEKAALLLKELFGTWQGFQDGMPQALFKLVLNKDGTFDFVSRLIPGGPEDAA